MIRLFRKAKPPVMLEHLYLCRVKLDNGHCYTWRAPVTHDKLMPINHLVGHIIVEADCRMVREQVEPKGASP